MTITIVANKEYNGYKCTYIQNDSVENKDGDVCNDDRGDDSSYKNDMTDTMVQENIEQMHTVKISKPIANFVSHLQEETLNLLNFNVNAFFLGIPEDGSSLLGLDGPQLAGSSPPGSRTGYP